MQVYCQRCDVLNEVPVYALYPTEAEIVCVQCGTVIFRGFLGQQVFSSNNTSPFTANLPTFPLLTRILPQLDGDTKEFIEMARQYKKSVRQKAKTPKRGQRVKRRIKVIYKGKFGENANRSGHPTVVRKSKKAL